MLLHKIEFYTSSHLVKVRACDSFIICTLVGFGLKKGIAGAYAGGGGGALGARAPPTWEKVPLRNVQKRRESSAQIMSAKKNVLVPLRNESFGNK